MKTFLSAIQIIFVLLWESVLTSLVYVFHSRKYNIKVYDKKLKILGQSLCRALPKMGPAFVKFGQFLSTRQDLVDHALCDELKNLHNRAPTVSFAKIETILMKELGSLYSDIKIEKEPIAAASTAQVHKGKITLDGIKIDVAIKVLRPKVKSAFIRNINIMMSVARFMNKFISPARRLRLEEIVKVISDTAMGELDLQLEAAVADKISYNCRDFEGIYVPKVFWKYTRKMVLVTEWVEGRKIDNIEKDKGKKIAKDLAFMFFRQAYVDGFFHADIHPGNILIDQHDRIVLIDFGMFSHLSERDRLFLAEIIYSFVKKDYDEVSRLHFEAGYVQSEKSNNERQRQLFALACRSITEPIFGKSASEISISKLLRRLFEVTSEFNMQTQPQLILLQKNMMSLEGVLTTLDDEVNMWKLVEPWFTEWAHNNLNFASKLKRKYNSLVELFDALEKKIKNT